MRAYLKKCSEQRINPIINRKYDKKPTKYRKKAREIFDEELYRNFRGVIEEYLGDWKQGDYYSQDIRKNP